MIGSESGPKMDRRPSEQVAKRKPSRIDSSVQFKARRPVSILKASKEEMFQEELGDSEVIQQGYLWDWDQDKEVPKQKDNFEEVNIQHKQQRYSLTFKHGPKAPKDNDSNS